MKTQVEKMFRLEKDCKKDETTDAWHGRVETRIYEAIGNLTFMDHKEQCVVFNEDN